MQRHLLPFWLAVLVEQLLVLALPLVGVLFPLLRFAPAIYGSLGRHRVYKLYSELKCLEDQLTAVPPAGTTKDFQVTRNRELSRNAAMRSRELGRLIADVGPNR